MKNTTQPEAIIAKEAPPTYEQAAANHFAEGAKADRAARDAQNEQRKDTSELCKFWKDATPQARAHAADRYTARAEAEEEDARDPDYDEETRARSTKDARFFRIFAALLTNYTEPQPEAMTTAQPITCEEIKQFAQAAQEENAPDAGYWIKKAAEVDRWTTEPAAIPMPDASTPSDERARYFDQQAEQYTRERSHINAQNSRTIAAHIRTKAKQAEQEADELRAKANATRDTEEGEQLLNAADEADENAAYIRASYEKGLADNTKIAQERRALAYTEHKRQGDRRAYLAECHDLTDDERAEIEREADLNAVNAQQYEASAEMYEKRAQMCRENLVETPQPDDEPEPPTPAKAPAHEPRDLWHESKFGTYKGEIKDKSGITVEINTDGLTVTTTIDGHEYRPHTFKTAAKRDRHIQTRANIFAGYDLAFSGSDEATTPKKRAARKAKAPEIAPELLELAQKLQVWANKQGVDINAILSGETPSSAPDILKAMAADKPLDAKAPAKEETSAPTIQSTPEPMPSAPTKEDASAPTINTQAVLFEGAEPTADAKAPEMPVTDPKPNWTERELEDAAQMFEERAQMYHERAKDADDQTAQRAKADAESAESSARQTRANLAAKRAATAPTDTARAVEEVKARRQHEAAFKAWTSLNETATSEDIKSASRNLNAACDALNAILSTPEHEAAQQHRANMARYFAELRTIRPTTTPALDTNDITDKQNARASIIPKRADKRRTSPRATSPRTTNRTNHHSNRRSMNTRNIPAARHRTEQDGGRI